MPLSGIYGKDRNRKTPEIPIEDEL